MEPTALYVEWEQSSVRESKSKNKNMQCNLLYEDVTDVQYMQNTENYFGLYPSKLTTPKEMGDIIRCMYVFFTNYHLKKKEEEEEKDEKGWREEFPNFYRCLPLPSLPLIFPSSLVFIF